LPLVSGVRHRVEGRRGIRFFDIHGRKIYLPAGRVRGIYKAPLGRILAALGGGFSAPDCDATGGGGKAAPK
jgi:hypothetical protein